MTRRLETGPSSSVSVSEDGTVTIVRATLRPALFLHLDLTPTEAAALRTLLAGPAEAALAELVALKDGPRNDDYERRKPAAWEAARAVVRRRG